jgi:sulfur carrier protein
MLKIYINGTLTEVEQASLGELIRHLRDDADAIATAINGEFVAYADRDKHTLSDRDRVDIVAPMAGG